MPRRKPVEIKLDGIAKELGAKVYSESPGFVCLFDQDVHSSVIGRGGSVAEAVNNWDDKLRSHLRNAGPDDPVVIYVKGHLAKKAYVEEVQVEPIIPRGRGKRPTWTDKNKPQHVIDFENQFYSSRTKRK